MRVAMALVLVMLLGGCAAPSVALRQQTMQALAGQKGWIQVDLRARQFTLTSLLPARIHPARTLTVYFEGDGLSWLSPDALSDDPTPVRPIGLELALAHPSADVAYVARPCQYRPSSRERGCSSEYWSASRYAPQIVADMDWAVDQLKQRFNASSVVLVGYSGGGALAALVAARRDDVVLLVTVAANIDIEAWTRVQGLQPLKGSLNPADGWQQLVDIPTTLFVGEQDQVVPLAVAQAYASRFPIGKRPQLVSVAGFDHVCCWASRWQELIGPLLAEYVNQSTKQTNSSNLPVRPSGIWSSK